MPAAMSLVVFGGRVKPTSGTILFVTGVASAARGAGDVYDFIRTYGVVKEEKKARSAQPVDVKTDVTVDLDVALSIVVRVSMSFGPGGQAPAVLHAWQGC